MRTLTGRAVTTESSPWTIVMMRMEELRFEVAVAVPATALDQPPTQKRQARHHEHGPHDLALRVLDD